jgi:hypothetical protein
MHFFKFFFLTAFFVSTLSLSGGVKILTESLDHSDGSKATGTVLIDGDMVRVDMEEDGGQAIVYDLGKKVITIINHQEKSWIKLTKKQIDDSRAQIKKQMKTIIEQQKALLDSLPPDQREMVEAQMKEITGQTKEIEIKYVKTDRTGKWNDQKCTIYDGIAGNKKVEELCTVVPKKINCSLVEIERLKQISTDFAVNDYQDGVAAWNNIKEIGIPVIQKSIENGKVVYTNTLVLFEKTKIPVDKFKIPADYKEIKMPSINNSQVKEKKDPAPPKKEPAKEKK